jgi:hypothetical protein
MDIVESPLFKYGEASLKIEQIGANEGSTQFDGTSHSATPLQGEKHNDFVSLEQEMYADHCSVQQKK